MIPEIDPLIGKDGVAVIDIVMTDPVFKQLKPVGNVHEVVPNTNSAGKVIKICPLIVIGMDGVIEKEKVVASPIIAGLNEAELIPIVFVLVFIRE